MDIYRAMVDASTPKELAELIRKMVAEQEGYRTDFYAEKRAHDKLKFDLEGQIQIFKEIRFDDNVPREHSELFMYCAEELDKLLLD
jgi:hypothetical protein